MEMLTLKVNIYCDNTHGNRIFSRIQFLFEKLGSDTNYIAIKGCGGVRK